MLNEWIFFLAVIKPTLVRRFSPTWHRLRRRLKKTCKQNANEKRMQWIVKSPLQLYHTKNNLNSLNLIYLLCLIIMCIIHHRPNTSSRVNYINLKKLKVDYDYMIL